MGRSRIKETRMIFVSHGLAILLFVILILSSIYAMKELQKISNNLFHHPFTTNDAALDLKIDVLIIRKNMLQIAAGVGHPERNKKDIQDAEADLRENIRVIKSSYLGDMSQVDQIESLLMQWHQEREKVFSHSVKDQQVWANSIIRTTGVELSEEIIEHIDYVTDFARHRAESYLKDSDQLISFEQNMLYGISVLILLSIVATSYLTRRFILQFWQLSQAEEEVRQLNAELDQRVKERTAELESFSYSVSHDLRVPLRAIDGFSRILLEEYHEQLDNEGKRLLGVVRTNTVRMAQLIDDILAFSRLGRKEMAAQSVDMEGQANATAAELATTWEGRDVKLNIGTLPPAHGDAAMLRQVWVNLLSNAVKFTRQRAEAMISVGGYTDGNEKIYYVKDNGVGFDMQYANKLFGVFQRLHGPAEFEGTGIGLAIVKRIITRHGGRVWAEGKVNEGATVYFTLPFEEKNHEL